MRPRKADKQVMGRVPLWSFLTALLALLAGGVMASTSLGYIPIPLCSVARAIGARLLGMDSLVADMDRVAVVTVQSVRLPRVLAAGLVGGGLAVAGAVFQGLLRNPLADPYTLGISAGAAFGASLALLFDIGAMGSTGIALCAFAGAVGSLLVVMRLAHTSGAYSANSLVLAGIIVASVLGAAISYLKYLADENVGVIIFWLMGSLAAKTWSEVGIVFVSVMLAMAVFVVMSRELNLIALGERTATSLGVNTQKVTVVLLCAASFVAAVCVSISGIIGFVGLVVPHLTRFLTGPDHRGLVPASFLTGAILLLLADTVTRAVLQTEVPIGVLTALIGGPFFCFLFTRQRGGGRGHGF